MTSTIGIAKAELLLTGVLRAQARSLARPGRGYRLYVLDEVALGVGRPDLVVLVASPAVLEHRRREGLRIRNWAEARVLAKVMFGERQRGVGFTREHTEALRRRLTASAWGDYLQRRHGPTRAIRQSLLVEAKVRDWRTGLAQLSRNRGLFGGAALLLPLTAAPRVPRAILRAHGIGLLVLDTRGKVRWVRRGPERAVPHMSELWLTELLVRSSEVRSAPSTGGPQRPPTTPTPLADS